jgi:hypothetical protein
MIQTTTAPGTTHPAQKLKPKHKGTSAIHPPHVATGMLSWSSGSVAMRAQVDPKYLISLDLKVFSVA